MIKLLIIIGLMLGVSNVAVVAQDDDELGGMVINFCTGEQWEEILEAFEGIIQLTLMQVDEDTSLTDTEALRTLHFLSYQGSKIVAGCSSTSITDTSNEDEGNRVLLWPGQYLIEVIADSPVELTIEQTTEVDHDCETAVIETEPFSDDLPQAWVVFPVPDGCGTMVFVETDARDWEINFRRLAEPDFDFRQP